MPDFPFPNFLLNDLFDQINWIIWTKTLVQVFIICYAVLWLWKRIAGTHAERLVKGMGVLAAVAFASWWLQLTLITSILHHLLPVAAMALVVVFQPEIRRGLGYLGRAQSFKFDLSLSHPDQARTMSDIKHIITAVRELSRTKTGALIVIEPPQGERDYVSPGTPVNSEISATLLLTIFFPKSPLHDGAVVIRKEKIVAAGVILPMTDNPKISYKYGTRHRAAIGLSETYDGLCIVVSEETGAISAASRGMLARYTSADELAEPIAYLYNHAGTKQDSLNSFLSLFGRGEPEAQEELPKFHQGEATLKLTDVNEETENKEENREEKQEVHNGTQPEAAEAI